MKIANKTTSAIFSSMLMVLSSCDYYEDIDEKQMLGSFQLCFFPENVDDITEYKQKAFTLMPNGKMTFHDINMKSVFGQYLDPIIYEQKFQELNRLPSEACSLNGVQGKWKFYNRNNQLRITLSIDIDTVKSEKLKVFLEKYSREGYYELDFGNFIIYGSYKIVLVDKSTIVIMTYYPDTDNIISQFFIKKSSDPVPFN